MTCSKSAGMASEIASRKLGKKIQPRHINVTMCNHASRRCKDV